MAGRDAINFDLSILLLARQPHGSQHDTIAGDFCITWRAVALPHREVAASVAEVRSVREAEDIEDGAGDEADQTRPRISRRATKKGINLRNVLNRSG